MRKGETLAEAEALDRKNAILVGAKALGHPVCDVIYDVTSNQNYCVTCLTKWDDDQHFTCPKYEGVTHR